MKKLLRSAIVAAPDRCSAAPGRFAAGHHAGAEQDRRGAERADADRSAADALTLLPAILMSRDAVSAHRGRAAFPAAGAGHADRAVESGAGGAGAVSLAAGRAAGGEEVYHKGWEPLERGEISAAQAWDQASVPIKTFLLKFAREKDIQLFVELSHSPAPAKPADVPLSALAPAYVLSELKAAFQIGAVLFLPFLIIDLVVASVTVSVGMVQLPPVMVSAPFKILLFVLVDGWNLVVGSLVRSFY